MNKFAKIKLSAELLEAAAASVRVAALNHIRWDDKCHLKGGDLWCDAEVLRELAPAGDEVLEVAEELAFRLEGLI